VQELFRLIDWLMVLPQGLEVAFRRELISFEEEKTMPYITSIERIGREEGRREEAANLVVRLARKRFATFGPEHEAAIRQLPLAGLELLSEALLDFAAMEDLRQWLASAPRQ